MEQEVEILLVEDNISDARLFTILLRETQFPGKVHWVPDGVEALDFLHRRSTYSNSPRPDAIVLGLNLPRKDGREVLKEVKTDSDLKSIPVFIVTTSSRDEDLIKAHQLGATYFYTKPKELGGFEGLVKTLATVGFALLSQKQSHEA
ncbi:response regulator [Oligoflexus tunisiensis]|uniref:response regulator n=1 Tax=Oligoflexus tunisiensis TaxID=708132 RepID=UPI000A9F6050|nr:response regulator [Oligoflexus tunisiensis]